VEISIRDARDDDDWDLVGLLAGCFSEYPGCVLDVHGEEPDLLAIATVYAAAGGRFWVAEDGCRVVGSIGMAPSERDGGIVLKKLYVARAARRRGLAAELLELVEDEARRRAAAFIELWSDTRFTDAHRFYARHGYSRQADTRELHDLSHTVELHFRKELDGAQRP
jgi:putative acetyltransferase